MSATTWAVLTVNEYPTPPTYRVVLTITASGGIDKNLFVVDVETETYQNVALSRDLVVYPTTKAEALDQGLGFYRVSQTEKTWDRQSTAAAFVAFVRERVASVLTDWESDTAVAFGGESTYLVTSADT